MNRISLTRYLHLAISRPGWIIAMCAAITLFLAWQLPALSFKTTVYDLVIEDIPESRQYHDFIDQFGSDEIIRVVVRAHDVLDPATFAKIGQLSDRAAGIDGVVRVISLPEIKKSVERSGDWNMDQFAAMLQPAALFRRNLISDDHKATIITVVLAPGADKEATIAGLRKIMASAGKDLGLYQTGMPLVSEALAEYTQADFFHLTPVALLVIAVLLALFMSHWQYILLPLCCVSLAIVWTFGLMAFFGMAVSMLTIIVPVFLVAVGTAYCMHIISEHLRQCDSPHTAAENAFTTFRQMTLPVVLAVGTTVIGLGSLGINRIAAIQEFALFTGIGMLSLLFIVLTFLPAMLAWLPPPSPRRRQPVFERFAGRLLDGIAILNRSHRRSCLLAIVAITLVCAIGMLRIRVETNPVSFFKRNTEVSRHFHEIYKDMSGSLPINVLVTGSEADVFESSDSVAAIENLQTYLETLPGVDKTISLADYLKLINYTMNRFEPEHYALPADGFEQRMLMNNFKIMLGNDFLQRFISQDYRQINILMFTHIASSHDLLETRAQILKHARQHLGDTDLQVTVTGLGPVIAASSQLITIGQIKSLSLSLVMIFAVMAVLFLSTKVGLIAVIPNLFPIVVNFGLMGLLGIELSMATSLIASVVIGLAVDDTIHYLVRYNSEFKKDLDKDRAMRDTLVSVGRPIILTSLTISIGFGVLIFSHFQPTAVFGMLMVVTMLSALVADVILLPALLMHVELVTAWDLLKLMPTLGGISPATLHELNQPLNAIKVGSDALKMMARKHGRLNASQLVHVADEIGDQVARASRMLQRLGEMGRPQGFERTLVNIGQPITDTLAIVEAQFSLESIAIALNITPDLPPVLANPSRLVQLVYNLLDNAREAILRQRTHDSTAREHRVDIDATLAGSTIVLTITDTGDGISDYLHDRIFEPFFTTSPAGQGKGLGLSISHQIIRDIGGSIAVRSRRHQGTTMIVRLPAAPRSGYRA